MSSSLNPRLMYPFHTDVATGVTTFALPDGRHMQFNQEYVEDYPERVCEHLTLAAREKGKEVARHPKYSAEAARLKAATWTDPRGIYGLSSTSTDAERKAIDKKIRDEYDSIFGAHADAYAAKLGASMAATKDVAAAKAIWSTHSSTTWVPSATWDEYSETKGELAMNPFLDKVVKMEYVGSRVTCSPAPTDTDEDVLLLTDDIETLIGDCIEIGFTRDGSIDSTYPKEFVSLRSGTMNFIITDNEEFFNKFMLATHVCKSLNVAPKVKRICVFQAILYGKEYVEETFPF